MRISSVITTTLLLLSFVQLVTGQDHEKKIARSQLPPASERTITEQSKGAEIRGFAQEREGGKTYYEAEMKVNGHSKDVLVDAEGKLIEVEEEVSIASLPVAVRNGLQAEAGTGVLRKVESITKENKLVAYEAQVVTKGKHFEVQVGPDGKPLQHEE
ncbi:MAG: hypothetical protein WBM04_10610 [Candidatus Korobacteraceae bacterium]